MVPESRGCLRQVDGLQRLGVVVDFVFQFCLATRKGLRFPSNDQLRSFSYGDGFSTTCGSGWRAMRAMQLRPNCKPLRRRLKAQSCGLERLGLHSQAAVTRPLPARSQLFSLLRPLDFCEWRAQQRSHKHLRCNGRLNRHVVRRPQVRKA